MFIALACIGIGYLLGTLAAVVSWLRLPEDEQRYIPLNVDRVYAGIMAGVLGISYLLWGF